jgi:hypothetical protein
MPRCVNPNVINAKVDRTGGDCAKIFAGDLSTEDSLRYIAQVIPLYLRIYAYAAGAKTLECSLFTLLESVIRLHNITVLVANKSRIRSNQIPGRCPQSQIPAMQIRTPEMGSPLQ